MLQIKYIKIICISQLVMTVFKTRDEYEQEDWERHRQKQRDIFERRKAKFEAEGYKCRHEGCGQSFRVLTEMQAHQAQHLDEMSKAMICNQPNCGKKFDNRKLYREHIEEHKVVAKRKVISCIRYGRVLNIKANSWLHLVLF